jgi:transporter family-2 protein
MLQMSTELVALLIAALAGLTMAVQGTLNSALGKVVGLLEATFVVNAVGLVLVSVLLFVLGLGTGSWSKVDQAPWYTFTGGILGVVITYTVVRSIPLVGVANATTAIVAAQVLTATAIDHLGLFGMKEISFTWHRLVGTVLVAGGAWLLLRR